jgi:hypothetical protein
MRGIADDGNGNEGEIASVGGVASEEGGTGQALH